MSSPARAIAILAVLLLSVALAAPACTLSSPGDPGADGDAGDDGPDGVGDADERDIQLPDGIVATDTRTDAGDSSAADAQDADAASADTTRDSADADTTSTDAQDSTGGDASVDMTGDTTEPDPCDPIAPAGSPAANHAAIQGCLDDVGHAHLSAGTFDVSGRIVVPPGGELVGLGSERPMIRLAPGNGTNTLIAFSDSQASDRGRVAHLRLNSDNAFDNFANASTVGFGGSHNDLEDCEIFNTNQPTAAQNATGVYVICDQCTGNVIRDNVIYNHFLGMIFRGADTSKKNRAIGNEIRDLKCDGITFVGYGEAENNVFRRVGVACDNGPIPGAAVYAAGNTVGARIVGNTVRDTCGNGFDIDESANFVIEDNDIRDPGYRWGGTQNHCSGTSLFMLDTRDSTIRNNTIHNSGRPHNKIFWYPHVFQAAGASQYSDLPAGSRQVIAFVLAERPPSLQTGARTLRNTIEDNDFISNCSPSSECVGMGFFASRATGFDGTQWGADTTNYFRRNNVFGSNIGSKRCGGNWYAADSTCLEGNLDPDCNNDDPQHNEPAGDWARNDGCQHY